MYFSCINVIRIHFPDIRMHAHTQNSILTLYTNFYVGRQDFRKTCWYSYTQINIHSVCYLFTCSPSNFISNTLFLFMKLVLFKIKPPLRNRTKLNFSLHLRIIRKCQPFNYIVRIFASTIHLIDSVNEDRRNVNGVRIKHSGINYLLHLSYHYFSSSSHICIKIPCSFMKFKVT